MVMLENPPSTTMLAPVRKLPAFGEAEKQDRAGQLLGPAESLQGRVTHDVVDAVLRQDRLVLLGREKAGRQRIDANTGGRPFAAKFCVRLITAALVAA